MKEKKTSFFDKLSGWVDKIGEIVEKYFKILIVFVVTFSLLILVESLLINYSPFYVKYIKSIAVWAFLPILVLICIVAVAKKIRYTFLGILVVIFSLIAPITNETFDSPFLLGLFGIGNIFISCRIALIFNKLNFAKLNEIFYPVKKVTSKKYKYAGKEVTETTEEKNYSFIYIFLLILPSIVQFVMSWLGKK